jgi:hypothetical protein
MLRAVAALGLLLLAGAVSAQSLGAVAAKEQQRREGLRVAAPATRVITEQELVGGKGRLATEPTQAAPTAAPVPTVGEPRAPLVGSLVEAEFALQGQREAQWRQEAQRRREAYAMAEEAAARAERWSDPTYAGTDRPWCPITARTTQKQARAELARTRQNLDALEEDARKGGALPGWIR